jgi:hypothetical protein
MVFRCWVIAAIVLLVPSASSASSVITVDSLLFQRFPAPAEVHFDRESGSLQFVFFPDRIVLSDGQIIPIGAGGANASAPALATSSVGSNFQTLTFSRDLARDYLTRFGSFISSLGAGFEIELGFLDLRIQGETGQGSGLLIGSGLLVADNLGIHAAAPVGTAVPILARVELLDGAVFGPDLTLEDFDLRVDGEVPLVVPEPSGRLLVRLGVLAMALHARRKRSAPRGVSAPTSLP